MDFLNGATATKPLTGDEFLVDELLDFSNIDTEEDELQRKDNTFSFFSGLQKTEHPESSVPETELFLPAEDVEDLEWLSQFVDDTISGCSLSSPDGKMLKNQLKTEPDVPVLVKSNFRKPVQTKARSKRAKTGGRVWSFKLPTKSVTATSSPPQQPRRCSHCLVQKTPQWRAGPLGPKTLCNACGVRFKSGRLLPEYRPACSPTFSSKVHSNNHRKVLEMRKKKEGNSEPESGSLSRFIVFRNNST